MIDPARIFEVHSRPVPRYTSYPTAPMFADVGESGMTQDFLDTVDPRQPVSLYIHIPFCDRLCWFCGCHSKQTRKYAPVAAYVDTLVAELELVGRALGMRPRLGHVHFGGGSPSLLREAECAKLHTAIARHMVIDTQTEISVEIDPSDVNEDTLAGLLAMGVTRASIGVQDFDPLVQDAINRPQTFAQTRAVVSQLRKAGIASVNIDALYGLPLQSADRLMRTINQVIALEPDRVALFGYAHVPWLKPHQRLIREQDLPGTLERFEHACAAGDRLADAGYVRIGIDHFARPDDALARAQASGELHRNFQGYTTDACEVLIGIGASSISRFPGGYLQNIVPTGRYKAAIEAGELPASRGLRLSDDDHVRGFMIERLMCDFEISYAVLRKRFGSSATPYITECRKVAALEREGLCESDDAAFRIPFQARPFARIVAARFDAYLAADSTVKFSKAV